MFERGGLQLPWHEAAPVAEVRAWTEARCSLVLRAAVVCVDVAQNAAYGKQCASLTAHGFTLMPCTTLRVASLSRRAGCVVCISWQAEHHTLQHISGRQALHSVTWIADWHRAARGANCRML